MGVTVPGIFLRIPDTFSYLEITSLPDPLFLFGQPGLSFMFRAFSSACSGSEHGWACRHLGRVNYDGWGARRRTEGHHMSQCLGSASKSLPGSTGLAAGSPLGRRTGVQRDGRRASHPVLCPLYPLSAASNFLARHSAGLALALSQPPGSAGRAWSPAQLHPTLWLCHGLARGRHTLPPCRPPTQPCTGSSALSSCCPGSDRKSVV